MSDLFTLKYVSITSTLGEIIKQQRLTAGIKSQDVTKHIGKTAGYLSKLEKGLIKKLDTDIFVSICNFVFDNSEDTVVQPYGVIEFLKAAYQKYPSFSEAEKNTLQNIDDLLVIHDLPIQLIEEIRKYMKKKDISVGDLCKQINSNTDLQNQGINFSNLDSNVWILNGETIDTAIIKLSMPIQYLEALLSGQIQHVHRVILEGVLNSLYILGKEDRPHRLANSKLTSASVLRIFGQNMVSVNAKNVDIIFDPENMDPKVFESLQNISTALKLIANTSKDQGRAGIKQIADNFDSSIGFYYAFIRNDLTPLKDKTKAQKQNFLNEVKELIKKYSEESLELETFD